MAIHELLQSNPEEAMRLAYLCSLCGLCTALCPEGDDPAAFFLGLRRRAVDEGVVDLSPYASLLAYEAKGVSRRYTWAHLPEGCDTVFFPGCGLSGTRPEKTHGLWEYLGRSMPGTGLVLDCCTKPSHDLGRQGVFESAFGELHQWLLDRGIRRVLVACPNCHKVFSQYGTGLETVSVYEVMAEDEALKPSSCGGPLMIHDPCAVRFETGVHRAVKALSLRSGAQVVDSARGGRLTVCCGEGGTVGAVCPEYSDLWKAHIHNRCGETPLLTYCSGCASRLGRGRETRHVLDLYFNGEGEITKGAPAPLTYLNRLRLKKRVQKRDEPAVTRARHVVMGGVKNKSPWVKFFLLLTLIAAGAGFHAWGPTDLLTPEAVRQWVQGYGIAAPLVFVALYCIAPCLMLPASPLTLAAGLLFGPVQGFFLTMVGATGAATLSFLIARYLAGDWVRKHLSGTAMGRLDRKVAEEGWKVVAFARLVPVFPFFLLNYAFGLTRVPLLHYVVATFVCIFPATLAFILFSSSLLDVLQGRVTAPFVGGLLLLVMVGLLPFIVRRIRRSRS